ncbi:MAG: glycoside hydrolase family 15 protein [Actinomycetota bacterium]|jgi:GH15 family glucan-1,4-alpha-glucosidase|nr:glycoside hydrolase family 15 protein [Actinomycetota bacterium]
MLVTLPIEDYGLIGDTHTAALVGADGSIDWLCLPRFDSEACFAALLGDQHNGFWRLAPTSGGRATRRRYRGDTLVLESEFDTDGGTVRIVDCMPLRETHPEVVRVVEGVRGTVDMRMDLAMRFGYGRVVPWVRRLDGLLTALAGPDGLALWTTVHTRGRDRTTVAEFSVSAGQHVPFVLTWFPSHEDPPRPTDAVFAIDETGAWWDAWAAQCTFEGEWRDAVVRSLVTLKALTYQPTGGIVAAATTSLPETLGGERNWDYRYCWLRDATLTLQSLMRGGYHEEAMAWRDWLLRAVAGDAADLQIMYGPAGERRLDEWEVDWLSGYEGSAPVRIGNAAAGQLQLDVYGEVMSALYDSARVGDAPSASAWDLQKVLLDFIESGWKEPDDGIWEVRGPRRHFTHSKVMAWVAVDRAVRSIEECGLDGPHDRWRALRDEIHAEVCAKGYNTDIGAFTQYYGSTGLDASLLMVPLVGFLPASDERVRSTVEAIERDLTEDGFVLRYRAEDAGDVDGLTGHEGAFLACSFWLADCLYLIGRVDDARALMGRLLDLRNDLGLLSEEYDARAKRQVGNFPQAFSHVSLVNAAYNLTGHPADVAQASPETLQMMRRATRQARHGSLRLQGRFLGMGGGARTSRKAQASSRGGGDSRRAKDRST